MYTLLTNEDEGHGNDEGENVASDGFVIFTVTFSEEMQRFVDVVLTQGLEQRVRERDTCLTSSVSHVSPLRCPPRVPSFTLLITVLY